MSLFVVMPRNLAAGLPRGPLRRMGLVAPPAPAPGGEEPMRLGRLKVEKGSGDGAAAGGAVVVVPVKDSPYWEMPAGMVRGGGRSDHHSSLAGSTATRHAPTKGFVGDLYVPRGMPLVGLASALENCARCSDVPNMGRSLPPATARQRRRRGVGTAVKYDTRPPPPHKCAP